MQYLIYGLIIAVILYHSCDDVSYSRLNGLVNVLSRRGQDMSDLDRAATLSKAYADCSKHLKRSLFLRDKWSELTDKAHELLSQLTSNE